MSEHPYCEHKVESVIENDTENSVGCLHSGPDIVVMEKTTKKCMIIDIACTFDNKLILKRNEKLDNYYELRPELARM